MSRCIFACVFDRVLEYDDFFTPKRDACGKIGICSQLKLMAMFCTLAYGIACDAAGESLGMSTTTTEAYVLQFCDTVVAAGAEYLHASQEAELQQILKDSER